MPPLILRFQRSYYPGVLCVDELRFPCASIYHLKVGYSQLRFRHHPPNHSRQPVFLSDGMFCDVCRRIGLSEDGQAEVISVEEMKPIMRLAPVSWRLSRWSVLSAHDFGIPSGLMNSDSSPIQNTHNAASGLFATEALTTVQTQGMRAGS